LPLSILAVLLLDSAAEAKPQFGGLVQKLTNFVTGSKCNKDEILDIFGRGPGRACAILFDEEDCVGDFEVVGTGKRDLDELDDDAESVLVRPGCVFVGRDRSGISAGLFGQGGTVEVQNIEGETYRRSQPRLKNLKGKDDLEEDISAVECNCEPPRKAPSRIAGALAGSVVGAAGRVGSGNAAGTKACKEAFASGDSADCILWDDEDCQVEDWDKPVTLTRGQSRAFTFSILEPLRSFRYRNTIESVSVRAGCRLEVYDDANYGKDDSGFGDQYTFEASPTAHLHVTLDESDILAVRALDDDINSARCIC